MTLSGEVLIGVLTIIGKGIGRVDSQSYHLHRFRHTCAELGKSPLDDLFMHYRLGAQMGLKLSFPSVGQKQQLALFLRASLFRVSAYISVKGEWFNPSVSNPFFP